MYYINKIYDGTTNVVQYIKYPLDYLNKYNTKTNKKEIKELDIIDTSKLSPIVYTIYDSILLHNNLIYGNKNINSLVYQLARLYSDKKLYSYSYSIHKICEIIFENYIGNKFIAIYDYDECMGYKLVVYKGKGDNSHKNMFSNSIVQNFGHVDVLVIKNIWKKFDIFYESEYELYNKICVPCIDNPFIDLKKNNMVRIIIIYLST